MNLFGLRGMMKKLNVRGRGLESSELWTAREAALLEEIACLEEEVSGWRKSLGVITHEVNNSLTPIISLSQTLSAILAKEGLRSDMEPAVEGLGIINERASNLRGFVTGYAKFARLPEVCKEKFELLKLFRNISIMHAGYNIRLESALDNVHVFGDSVQLEQVFINIIKNAIEANGDPVLPIEIRIKTKAGYCEIGILDCGAGVENPADLFVPFHSTKVQGAGVGLTLARRVILAHQGSIAIGNRGDKPGTEVLIRLPLSPLHSSLGAAPHLRWISGRRPRRITYLNDNNGTRWCGLTTR